MKKITIAGLILCCLMAVVYVARGPLRLIGTDSDAIKVNLQDEKWYKELSKDDPKLANLFDKLNTFTNLIAVVYSGTKKIFPEKWEISGVEVPVREMVGKTVQTTLDFRDLVFAIVKYVKVLQQPLDLNAKCLVLSDEDLRHYAAHPNKSAAAAFDPYKCGSVGCINTKTCLANMFKRTADALEPLFIHGIGQAKVVTKEGKKVLEVDGGILLNIESIASTLLELLVSTNVMQNQLKEMGWQDKVNNLMEHFKAMRIILGGLAGAINIVPTALEAAGTILLYEALTELEEQAKGKTLSESEQKLQQQVKEKLQEETQIVVDNIRNEGKLHMDIDALEKLQVNPGLTSKKPQGESRKSLEEELGL